MMTTVATLTSRGGDNDESGGLLENRSIGLPCAGGEKTYSYSILRTGINPPVPVFPHSVGSYDMTNVEEKQSVCRGKKPSQLRQDWMDGGRILMDDERTR